MMGASIDRQPGGWHVRIPLHREEITIRKEVIVVEEVDIKREVTEEPDEGALAATVVAPTRRVDHRAAD